MSEKKFNCYKCEYRGTIPGDAHSCCRYPGVTLSMVDFLIMGNWRLISKLGISGDPYGIRNGWFMWPVNFDPVWLRSCDGFKQKE